MNTVQTPQTRILRVNSLDPVALTALLTLKEALVQENYEICQEVIDTALEFGATQGQVFGLLEDIRRSPVTVKVKKAA